VERKGFSVTANLLCSRAVFDSVGGFDIGVPEDVEWCRRATARGFRLGYSSKAIVGHPARRTWPELTRKWRRLNREMFSLYARRPLGRLVWLARSLALPVSALVHTPRVFASPELVTLGQRLGALWILYRLRFWRFSDALRLPL
jgi:GT2 family glycosyltransferase